MNRVALLIGGNQGDRRALIGQATELIRERIGSVVAVSGVYETEPWGEFEVGSDELGVKRFFNRALVVDTEMTAQEVLHEALEIESELGRVRKEGSRLYSSRPMDIDLIFYNEEVIETEELTIPHPRMHLRQFVLEPLAEIMPGYRHPVLGVTVREVLEGVRGNNPATPCGGSNNITKHRIPGVETPGCMPSAHYVGSKNINIHRTKGVETPGCKPSTHYLGSKKHERHNGTGGIEATAYKPSTHCGGSGTKQ